jgi:hypothetical protein
MAGVVSSIGGYGFEPRKVKRAGMERILLAVAARYMSK